MRRVACRRLAGYIGASILIFVVTVVVYYTVVVAIARERTPEIFSEALSPERIVLRVEDLTEFQLNALLEVEDPNFYGHNGMDLKTPGGGLTTITQALVKRLYFEHFEMGLPKIKQTLIAVFAVDQLISKHDQLLLFVNDVRFLHNLRGLEEAARYYYEKPFKELTEDEYLSIVAMIIAPRQYDIFLEPEANQERVNRIKRVLSGEYVPRNNSDVFYEDEMNAINWAVDQKWGKF